MPETKFIIKENIFRIHVRHVNKSSYLWAHKSEQHKKKSLGTFQDAPLLPFYLMFSALFFGLVWFVQTNGGYIERKNSSLDYARRWERKKCENSKKDLHTCQTRAFFFVLNCFVVELKCMYTYANNLLLICYFRPRFFLLFHVLWCFSRVNKQTTNLARRKVLQFNSHFVIFFAAQHKNNEKICIRFFSITKYAETNGELHWELVTQWINAMVNRGWLRKGKQKYFSISQRSCRVPSCMRI